MDNRGLAVDISLLAVLIALHTTRNNRNFELVVMALLFAHVLMTTDAFLNMSKEPVEEEEEAELESTLNEVDIDPSLNQDPEPVADELGVSNNLNPYQSSDGGFDRMFVAPKEKKTPPEANVELAKARTSFFQELFPNK